MQPLGDPVVASTGQTEEAEHTNAYGAASSYVLVVAPGENVWEHEPARLRRGQRSARAPRVPPPSPPTHP